MYEIKQRQTNENDIHKINTTHLLFRIYSVKEIQHAQVGHKQWIRSTITIGVQTNVPLISSKMECYITREANVKH